MTESMVEELEDARGTPQMILAKQLMRTIVVEISTTFCISATIDPAMKQCGNRAPAQDIFC